MLFRSYRDIPHEFVDEVILVDDCSRDDTPEVAKRLGIHTIIHPENRGYGGNQKTCYSEALAKDADVVVMLHPDYQYDPKLLLAMSSMIIDGPYDCVLGSRILGGHALKGGMPIWKYFANRCLSWVQYILTGAKLSEFHTGYRAFSREVLQAIPFEKNSDDFVFDSQMLTQIFMKGFLVGELSCPTKYFPEASSINFLRSMKYGLGVIGTCILFRLHRWGMISSRLFR
mgnify:CR=1 FL=1